MPIKNTYNELINNILKGVLRDNLKTNLNIIFINHFDNKFNNLDGRNIIFNKRIEMSKYNDCLNAR